MSFVFKAVKSVVKAVVKVVKTVVVGLAGVLLGGLRKKGNAGNKATNNRLSKSLDPEDFRKIVLGKTALAVDLRYWELWGSSGNNYDEVLAAAGHQIEGFDELYVEEDLVTFSGSAATGKFAGVLSRATNNGAVGNAALSVGGGTRWNSNSKFRGTAHYKLAWVIDDKKLPGGVPSRYTQVGRGSRVYDPRRDSTRGGSGTHRVDDQSTWSYATLDGNGQPIGRNNALQMLRYLIGWRIQNPSTSEWVLVDGRGVDPNDINWPDMIAAANDAEALGYYTDMILSTGDEHETNEAIISADGLLGELLDPGGLWTYKIVKDDTADWAVHLTDDDVVEGGDVEWNPQAPFGDKFNEVAGTYIDPSATSLYQPKAYPTVTDAAYVAADGRRKRETHNFQCVQDPALAQKLARIKLNRTRFTGEFKATFNFRALKAQAWSVVKLSLERYAFTEKLFRVVSQSITPEGIEMLLREDHPSIYAGGTVVAPTVPSAMAKYDPRMEIPVTGLAGYPTTRLGAAGAAEDGLTVLWDAPPGNVRRTEVQFKRSTDVAWAAGFTGQSDQLTSWVGPLLSSSAYNVRVRHVSIHEVAGPWGNISVTTGADGRVTSSPGKLFLQPTPPSAQDSIGGDKWQDDNAVYWLRREDNHLSIAGNRLMVAGNLLVMTWAQNPSQPVADGLGTVAAAVSAAAALAADAQATADGKVQSFYSPSEPVAEGVGDLWFDTDDGNKQYRWSGTAWVAVQDTKIGDALNAAAAADAKADGKVTTFISETTPVAEGDGDLWFKASTGELRRWSATGSTWGDPLVDLTSAAQIVVVPAPTMTLYRTSSGAVKSDQLPAVLRPAVTRGGVDYRTNNAVSYSVTGFGGLAGKVTVENGAGSASKGDVTIDDTVTGEGYFELSVTVSGISVGKYITQMVTIDDLPLINNSGAGGSDTTLANVSSTTYVAMTGLDADDPVLDVTIASGQTLKLVANFKYQLTPASASPSTGTLTCKAECSSDNWSTVIPMNSGPAEVTGTTSTAGAFEDRIKGEMIATFTKTSLAPGTYKVRLMGKRSSGTGTINAQTGSATTSKA